MKVLLVAGVGERPEAHLFPELAARGIDITLLCDTRSPYFDSLKAMGFPMTHFVMKARIDLSAILILRRTLRAGSYNILHAFNSRALSNGLIASTGMDIKRIGFCGTMGHLKRWDPSARMAVLSARADRIVCVSEAVKNYLRRLHVPESRLVRIYAGHHPSWFTAHTRSTLREFGVPDDAFVIACAARMRPIKGVPVLMEAVRRLSSELPIHVLLLGQNDDAEVRELLSDGILRERVHLTGFRMDAPALMGACDLFVMPTLRNEGLSKAVAEAMCMGIPSVISSVGGMVELVNDGQSGAVVPPNDPIRLAEAIRNYAVNPVLRKEHGAAARKRLVESFSFSQMADQTITMYHSLTKS
ncbi:MAG: glycosyltransferase family 4 protein [bacterium]